MKYTCWIWASENDFRQAERWWDTPAEARDACLPEAQRVSAAFCCVVSRDVAREFRPEDVYRRAGPGNVAYRSPAGWMNS